MKNLFSLFFKKANSTKHLLCLLFLIAFIAPIGSKAQSSFTCSFGNPDGPDVIACGSVVTATITFPANIENITLTFPNTFQVTTPINGAIYLDAPLSLGSLRTLDFLTASIASPMTVTFAYMGCNVSGNNENANTSNLFFDCVGKTGNTINDIVNAVIVNPSTGIGLLMFAGESATANHSLLKPISITTTQTTPQTGPVGSPYNRVFTVTINSLSIETFDLGINNETDILLSSPNVLTIDGPTTNINFNYGDNVFNAISLDDYSANVTETNGIRKITFHQSVTRLCSSSNPLSTSVTARINCVCEVPNSGFYSSSIELNSVVANPIEFQNISSILTPGLGTTPGCAGIYNYDVLIKVTADNANLQSSSTISTISIPINSNNFTIESSGAIIYAVSSGPTYPIPTADLLSYTTDNTAIPGLTTISIVSPITISGIKFITIRLKLSYTCFTASECENTSFTLTPLTNNNITFNIASSCASVSTTYPIVEELPEITEPETAPTTIIGGATNFSFVIPGSVPFNYQLSLPQTSTFSLIYNNNPNVTYFNCGDFSYRAILSLEGASFGNLASIENLLINGSEIIAEPSDGKFIFNLPENINNPGVYNIDFNLVGMSCPQNAVPLPGFPPNTNASTFGSYTFQLSIQEICDDCNNVAPNSILNPCVRNLACASDLLFVHCPGDCDGLVGIESGVTIKRSTFGWENEAYYPNTPITNESFFDNLGADEKERQLHRMYPYDIFTVNATGELKNYFVNQDQQLYTHNWVGFRMNFTNTDLGENFFDLIDYTITFSQSGQTDIVINDLASVAIVPLGAIGVAGLPDQMFQRELIWNLLPLGVPIQTALSTGTWNITFTARFRVTATSPAVPIGFYPLDFQCQFISESYLDATDPSTFTSCDPYGASILVLIPEVQVAQQSVQYRDNFSVETPLINDNSVGATLPNNACGFHRIVGLRHRGGLGDAVDDFPYEFRPLSAWGDNAISTNLNDVNDLYNGSENYTETPSNPVNFSNTNPNLPLLPAAEKGDITQDFQGLVLGINRNCPTYSQSESIPLDLSLRHFATSSAQNN
jgi:hypothetical protein